MEMNQPTTTWEEMYQQLIAYKTENGHCCVPFLTMRKCNSSRSKLSRWVSHQRRLRRQGKLDAIREKQLIDIEFNWGQDTDASTNGEGFCQNGK